MSTHKKQGEKEPGTPIEENPDGVKVKRKPTPKESYDTSSSSDSDDSYSGSSCDDDKEMKKNPDDVKVKERAPPKKSEDVAGSPANMSLDEENKEIEIEDLLLLHGVSTKIVDSIADKGVTIKKLKEEKKASESLKKFQKSLQVQIKMDEKPKTKGAYKTKVNEIAMGVSVLLAKDILEDDSLKAEKKVEQAKQQVYDAITCMEKMQTRKIADRKREKRKEQEEKEAEQEKKKEENRDQIKRGKEE